MYKNFIFCIFAFSFSITSYTQNVFNRIYPLIENLSNIEILHDSHEFFYSVDYASQGSEIGIQVVKYNVNNGDKLTSAYFGLPGRWLFTAGRTPIFEKDRNLYFGICSGATLMCLEYSIDNNSIRVKDSVNTNSDGVYISDLSIMNDTIVYKASFYKGANGEELYSSIIFSYPNKTNKFVTLSNKDINNLEIRYGSGKLFSDNDTLLIFNGKYYKGYSDLCFIKADMNGNTISEFNSGTADFPYGVDDAIKINEHEYLVLASGEYRDHIKQIFDLIHLVYRINMKTKKVIWRTNYAQPTTDDFTAGGEIIAGHKPNEYLYNTVATAKGSTKDSSFTVGRVVKIDGNGKKIWQKDYAYSTKNNHANDPYSLIATSDGNYLFGGHVYTVNNINSWLVKIDEQGNIVPIDTTSTTKEPILDIPDITIYPNPAHDYIIINQGEQTDMVYMICDIQGHVVMTQNVTGSHQNTMWDISELPAGTYVLSISQKGKPLLSWKLVVE